jgi:hypothetical protein
MDSNLNNNNVLINENEIDNFEQQNIKFNNDKKSSNKTN